MAQKTKWLRLGSAAVPVALIMAALAPAGPAHAAPPPNDTANKAIEITTVPEEITADTRSATWDRVKRSCVGGHSVWYRHTPTTSGPVKITTVGSSFDTVLAVYTGKSSPTERIACNDDRADLTSAVRPRLTAGKNYWIAVSSCCMDRTRRGGDLTLRVYRGLTPAVQVTLDSAEAGAVSGRMRIHGTVTCATPSVVYGEVYVSQMTGEHVARGSTQFYVGQCLPASTEWVVRIDSDTGWAFQPGLLATEVFTRGYDGFTGAAPASAEANLAVAPDPDGRPRP